MSRTEGGAKEVHVDLEGKTLVLLIGSLVVSLLLPQTVTALGCGRRFQLVRWWF